VATIVTRVAAAPSGFFVDGARFASARDSKKRVLNKKVGVAFTLLKVSYNLFRVADSQKAHATNLSWVANNLFNGALNLVVVADKLLGAGVFIASARAFEASADARRVSV
jgi:hypothetical protein